MDYRRTDNHTDPEPSFHFLRALFLIDTLHYDQDLAHPWSLIALPLHVNLEHKITDKLSTTLRRSNDEPGTT